MKKLEASLAASRARLALLGDKKTSAERQLADAIKARQSHLLEGDVDDANATSSFQTKVDTAQSALNGVNDALAVLQEQIEAAEGELNAEREREARKTAAGKLAQQVAAIHKALPEFLRAGRALADALMQVGHWHFESRQAASFVSNVVGEVEVAGASVAQELLITADGIKGGTAAIPPEAQPELVATNEQPPLEMTIFLLRSVKFRDHSGKVCFGRQFDDCVLPSEMAQRALNCGAAVPLADPRRGQLRGVHAGRPVNPRAIDLVDLDKETTWRLPSSATQPGDEAAASSVFKDVDRSSEARTLSIPVMPP